jgi:chromosome partitioning protein
MFGKKRIAMDFYRPKPHTGGLESQNREVKIMTFASQKGGTGKTTSAQTLASCLARYHHKRVLCVDLDPQGSFGQGMLEDLPNTAKTADRLLVVPNANLSEYIIKARPNLDLIPNLFNSDVRESIERAPFRPDLLRRLLRPVLADYDYVIIDTPAGISRSTQFGLDVAEQVVFVMSCGKYALLGVSTMLDWFINHCHVRSKTVPGIRVVLNNFDSRRRFDRDFKEEVEYIFGEDLYHTHIRPSVKIVEAAAFGTTVIEHSENSGGAIDFKLLTREILGLPTDVVPHHQTETQTMTARPALRLVS